MTTTPISTAEEPDAAKGRFLNAMVKMATHVLSLARARGKDNPDPALLEALCDSSREELCYYWCYRVLKAHETVKRNQSWERCLGGLNYTLFANIAASCRLRFDGTSGGEGVVAQEVVDECTDEALLAALCSLSWTTEQLAHLNFALYATTGWLCGFRDLTVETIREAVLPNLYACLSRDLLCGVRNLYPLIVPTDIPRETHRAYNDQFRILRLAREQRSLQRVGPGNGRAVILE